MDKNEIIKAIIKYYGEPSNRGCYINGKWFSLDKIIEIIEGASK